MAHNKAELGGVQASDNPGPKRFESVAILPAKHGAIGLLPIPLTDIIPDAVAKDVIQGVFLGDVPRLLAYDYRIGNDISQRDWQQADRTMFRGKNCDTF